MSAPETFELAGIEAMQRSCSGFVLDELKRTAADFRTVQRRLAMIEGQKIAKFIDKVEVVAREAAGGLRPVFDVPQRVLAAWEAKFKMDYLQRGGDENTWTPYCWYYERGKDSWSARFMKLNPELCYKERKRDNSTIKQDTSHLIQDRPTVVSAGKYAELPTRPATQVQNMGHRDKSSFYGLQRQEVAA